MGVGLLFIQDFLASIHLNFFWLHLSYKYRTGVPWLLLLQKKELQGYEKSVREERVCGVKWVWYECLPCACVDSAGWRTYSTTKCMCVMSQGEIKIKVKVRVKIKAHESTEKDQEAAFVEK